MIDSLSMKIWAVGVIAISILFFTLLADFTPDAQIQSGQVIKIHNQYYKCSEQEFAIK